MDRLRNFGFLLKDVSRRYVLRFEQHAAEMSLTLVQCRALIRLEKNEGVSQARLAELIDVEPMAMVRILDRMEADGVLERRPDPDDRRARRLYLTAKAKPLLEEIWRLADADAGRDLRRHRARRARGLHRRARAARRQSARPRRRRAAPVGATQLARRPEAGAASRRVAHETGIMNASTPSEQAACRVHRSAAARPAPSRAGRRAGRAGWTERRLRLPLMLFGPIVVAIVAAYVYLTGGRYESTDDAYVQAARVAISANVAGRVVELDVHDNQPVHKGEVLFRLDDAPFRIAVDEASAQLAAARLQVESLKANYRQRQAELASAAGHARLPAARARAPAEAARLGHRFAAAGRSRRARARRRTRAARRRAAAGRRRRRQPRRQPEHRARQAPGGAAGAGACSTAPGSISRTRRSRRRATASSRASSSCRSATTSTPSAPVFALVSTSDIWVEANFKEDQLTHMRVGQSADGRRSTAIRAGRFEGEVASLSPGTGSQFSLLPPENATGNWVKVVQRLPVRVRLDAVDPAYPLHAGLSADVSVDTQHQRHLFGARATRALAARRRHRAASEHARPPQPRRGARRIAA